MLIIIIIKMYCAPNKTWYIIVVSIRNISYAQQHQ